MRACEGNAQEHETRCPDPGSFSSQWPSEQALNEATRAWGETISYLTEQIGN